MTVVEQMVATLQGALVHRLQGHEGANAIEAILRKHIEPMVATAFACGQAFERDQMQPNAYMPRITPEMYARDVISKALKDAP